MQFIFDLPQRLRKCMSAEDYVGAVKHYEGALPILKVILVILYNKELCGGCTVMILWGCNLDSGSNCHTFSPSV